MSSDVQLVEKQITKSDLEVKAIIQEIWRCDSSLDDLNQLNQSLAKCIYNHKTGIIELERMLLEAKKPSDRESLLALIDGYKGQLELNFGSLRKANAYSKKLIEENVRKEVFGLKDPSDESDGVRKRKAAGTDKKSIATKASNVTEDLLSLSRMLSSQVVMSEQSLSTLVDSSATVTETQEEFKMMGSLLTQSRKLLFKYGRREITDRVLIIFALAFFFASCFYVVMKRLF